MYIIISLLCAVSLHGADQDLVKLSEAIAPVAEKAQTISSAVDSQSVINALKEYNCPFDSLMRLPVVQETKGLQLTDSDYYACKENNGNIMLLSYNGGIYNRYLVTNIFKEMPVVGHWDAGRYVPIVHVLNKKRLPNVSKNDIWHIKPHCTILDDVKAKGHDVTNDYSGKHHYDLLRLLLDNLHFKAFNEIAGQFSIDDLSSHDRLCQTFFNAQKYLDSYNCFPQRKEEINKTETIFIKKSAKKSTSVCKRIAQVTFVAGSITGLLGLMWLRGDYSGQEVYVPGTSPLQFSNQTIE